MSQANYGATAATIDKINDIPTLQRLLHDPQYAGFTAVIIAKMSEINRLKQGAQAQQPQPPSVAQQAVQGQAPQAQPPQGMASGGIVAFRHGGKVKKYAEGGDVYVQPPYDELYKDQPSQGPTGGQEVVQQHQAPFFTHNGAASVPYIDVPPTEPIHATTPVTGIASMPKAKSKDSAPKEDAPKEKYTVNPKEYNLNPDGTARDAAGIGAASRVSNPNGVKIRSFSDYLNDMRQGNGEDMANLREDRARIKEGIAQNPHMAMISAGLNMAHDASVNPHSGFMGNVAAGGIGGLDYYTKQADQSANQLRDLNKVSRQENQAMRMAAVHERGQDTRAAAATAAQSAYYKMLMSKGYLDDRDLEQYAFARAKEDANNGIKPKDHAFYKMEAKQMNNSISSGVQAAGIRGDTAAQTSRANWIQKMASGAYMGKDPNWIGQQYDQTVTRTGNPPPTGAPALDLTQNQ